MDVLGIVSSLLGGAAAGAAATAWLAKTIIGERVRVAVEHEYDRKFEDYRKDREEQDRLAVERCTIKRQSCLSAIEVVDRVMTNFSWSAVKAPILAVPVDIMTARRVFNELAITCDGPEVLIAYARALGLRTPEESPQDVSADAIHDLRNAIRAELGFGNALDIDRRKGWIASLTGQYLKTDSLGGP